MPVKSNAQARFMGAVASGKLKRKGLSKEEAREFLRGSKLNDLPERVGKMRMHEDIGSMMPEEMTMHKPRRKKRR